MKTLKELKLILGVIVAGILVISFSSCNNKNRQKESPEISDELIEKEVEEYIYPLPSTFEVTNMLNEIEASYIFDISNSPEKAGRYMTEKSFLLYAARIRHNEFRSGF